MHESQQYLSSSKVLIHDCLQAWGAEVADIRPLHGVIALTLCTPKLPVRKAEEVEQASLH